LWRSFRRSQVTSAAATAVDFGLVFGLTELVGFWYVASVAIGAAAGAVTNFALNRRWAFRHTEADFAWKHSVRHQAWRYALVSSGSLILNTLGVWALTETTGIPYGFSVVGVSLAVGFFFNFPLQRRFVFG
jgi:dolichol-phosphate mannosyltransferase